MKLYECQHNVKVRVVTPTQPPPDGIPVLEGEVLLFKHIDGMYSYCINKDGDVVHLKAWSEVELVPNSKESK